MVCLFLSFIFNLFVFLNVTCLLQRPYSRILHFAQYDNLSFLEHFVVVKCLNHVQLFATPWTAALPDFPVLQYLMELAQIHVHRVCDAIQQSHPLAPPSPPALHLSQHQGLSQWVSSLHQVAKVLDHELLIVKFRLILKKVGKTTRPFRYDLNKIL